MLYCFAASHFPGRSGSVPGRPVARPGCPGRACRSRLSWRLHLAPPVAPVVGIPSIGPIIPAYCGYFSWTISPSEFITLSTTLAGRPVRFSTSLFMLLIIIETSCRRHVNVPAVTTNSTFRALAHFWARNANAAGQGRPYRKSIREDTARTSRCCLQYLAEECLCALVLWRVKYLGRVARLRQPARCP